MQAVHLVSDPEKRVRKERKKEEEGEKEKEIEHRELGCSYFPQFLRPGVEDGPKE